VSDPWTTPERILGIGGGATEVLADLAGRLLGYTAGAVR
jgi:hypothetical protein